MVQYMGAKSRLVKKLAPVIQSLLEQYEYPPYYEPFVGAANIISNIEGSDRFASDVQPDIIKLWQATQTDWTPPTEITEEEWRSLKGQEPSALRAFAGFGCSFGGRFFEGYARNGRGDNYARAAHNSIIKIKPLLDDVTFFQADYKNVTPEGFLIYCDPPYRGTKFYSGTPTFDHDDFWNTVRIWSEKNVVLVSETTIPSDFTVLWEQEHTTEIRNGNGKRKHTSEKLCYYSLPDILPVGNLEYSE
jgi:DNA adenine methylase